MEKHDRYIVVNNSGRPIEYDFVTNYPDTIIPVGINPKTDQPFYVLPYSTKESPPIPRLRPKDPCIEDGKYGTFWLYFFDKDSLDALSWDTIRITGRGILERKAIDLDYLKAHNFTLTYEE
jgi:hypothetical protein